MRIGLLYGVGPDAFAAGTTYDDVWAQVEEADRLGLDSVLFEEHHGARGCPAPASLATAAAVRTRAIRVGAADRQLALSHPVHTAEDFAVADVVSRGRVILGVSPGERREDWRSAGLDWDTRHERFREAVEFVRAAWTQDSFQYVGEHVRFPLGADGERGWRREPYAPPYVDQWRRGQVVPQHLPVLPKPVQVPHPPIWVRTSRRDLVEWAAGRGLSMMCSTFATDAEVRSQVGWYTDALASAGRDQSEVDVVIAREVFLAETGERARQRALASLRAHLDAVRSDGSDDATELGALHASQSELLDSCFLVGSPAEVLDRLKSMQADLGMTHLVARVFLPGRSHLDVIDSIRLLASEIATRLLA